MTRDNGATSADSHSAIVTEPGSALPQLGDHRCTRRAAAASILAGGVSAVAAGILRPVLALGQEQKPGDVRPERLISRPVDGTHVDAAGVLCEANGTAEGADRVYAWVYQDPANEPGQFPPPGAPFSTPDGGGHWNLDLLLSGAVAGVENHIKVWYEAWTAQGPVITDTDDKPFTPQNGDCTAPPPVPTSEGMGGATLQSLTFHITDVAYPGMGTWLRKSATQPLRASKIKIWATDVDWKDDGGVQRTHPAGNGKEGEDGWWSPKKNSKQYAILLWQPTKVGDNNEKMFVVEATKPANWLAVSPQRDIFIQLNGKRSKKNDLHKKHKLTDNAKPLVLMVEYLA